MFRPLADLIARLRGKSANTAAFDLTVVQLSQLATLRTYSEWQAFIALADSVSRYRAEALLYENDVAKNAFLRGQIAMIRELPLLVERLATQTNDAKHRDRDGHTNGGQRNDDRRRASLFATPSWPKREQHRTAGGT